MATKLTKNEFVEKAKNVHGDKYNYDNVEYINNRTKVLITCKIHGDFYQTPAAHLLGQNCPKCGIINKANSHRTSWSDLVDKFKLVHGEKYYYEPQVFKTINDSINIICNKHQYTFSQRIIHHLNGHGCPICNGGRKRTTEMFIIKAKSIHGDRYDYSKVEYVTKEKPVCIICPKHGEFIQKAHDHICGCGCPRCKSTKTQERIFQFLLNTFPDENWSWESSPKWLYPQRFDIYNESKNLAIEYNGEQHYFPIEVFGGKKEYENRILLDAKKKDICAFNKCELYVIKYDNVNYDRIREDIANILNNKQHEN